MMSKKLEILKQSKVKKEENLNRRFSEHFSEVREANGQPLNDKRNGAATLNRWERQNDGIQKQIESIKKTEAAIEREVDKVNDTQSNYELMPDFLKKKIDEGELKQWRRFPHILFVKGVDGGRLKVDFENKAVTYTHLSEVSIEHYPIFRDTVNEIRAWLKAGRWK